MDPRSCPPITIGASAAQKGEAAQLRYGRIFPAADRDVQTQLHEIVHSSDDDGRWANNKDNRFRDRADQYDARVERVLEYARTLKKI
jgi:hypothetical protein